MADEELPIRSFCLPDLPASAINYDCCICADCSRKIAAVNFYNCPKPNCLVQAPKPLNYDVRLLTVNEVNEYRKLKKKANGA